ncbi:MAG: phenylalanine--tRNA ligase subunit beta [Acidimicrobiales bacterium]
MRVPLSWIRDFAPVPGDGRAVAGVLDDLGLVVEEIVEVGKGLEDVVVARVEEIGAIDGADRIRRVVVTAGAGPVEVVCGAWNFEVGQLVPLAPVGAVLPGGFEIGRRKMKGVVSNGMLCSPSELQLSEDHGGILILDDREALEPGTPLMEALGIDSDVVFDVAVTANRPDCWSVVGIARDLAASCKVPFAVPEPRVELPTDVAVSELTSVEVVDRDLCPRFTARVLRGVAVTTSPQWMARRLVLAGMRPINSVVDASNYVMLELGQPTHPYDLKLLAGKGLRVRAAAPGEVVVTLDGQERVMGTRSVGGGDDRRDCLICDAEDRPVGIGGIMGGASSEIAQSTTEVLLEAAYFTPMAIARTSKRLSLRTEASARFERGCDPEGIDRAALRLVELLVAGSGPGLRLADGVIDIKGDVPVPRPVTVRTARVNTVLGTTLDTDEIASLLDPIGFTSSPAGAGVLQVTIPTFRPDSEREIDVIEEVARLYGYSRIERRRPSPPQVGARTRYQRGRDEVRDIAAGLGAHEAWTTSLLRRGDHERCLVAGGVEVANPLTPDDVVLRRTLMPGMLRALAHNEARRQGDIRLFEIGHVFPPPDDGRLARAFTHEGETVIDEREHLGVLLAGHGDDALSASASWQSIVDALSVAGSGLAPIDSDCAPGAGDVPARSFSSAGALHPTRRAEVEHHGTAFGVVGEVDPRVLEAFDIDSTRRRVGWIEVDLETLLDLAASAGTELRSVSRFPSSDIDLAFVLGDSVPAASLTETLRRAGGAELEWVRLFDVYRAAGVSEGTRSLTYRLRFCADDHTLDEQELAALRQRCIDAALAAHGATLRA